LQRNFKKQISEPVDLALSRATPDMWDKVLKTFRTTLDKAEAAYLAKAKSTSPRDTIRTFIDF
jgi:protein SEY1